MTPAQAHAVTVHPRDICGLCSHQHTRYAAFICANILQLTAMATRRPTGAVGVSSKHSMQSGFHQATQQSLSVRSTGGARRQITRMMPIGVPRVPYRTPRENVWQWVDIWNCLVR